MVRKLIERLVAARPDLANDLQEGLPYIGSSEQGSFRGRVKDGKFVVNEHTLDDESLITPADKSLYHVKNMARRYDIEVFPVAADELNCLPPGASVEAAHGIQITNWDVHAVKPDLSGPQIDPVVPAKIAFEFLALRCGDAIYENPPQLAAIRRQLLAGELSEGDIHVKRLMAENDQLLHGLVFEGNVPGGAQVQIRLFGRLAFRVQFRCLTISGCRVGYTHDLIRENEGLWIAEETAEHAEDSFKG